MLLARAVILTLVVGIATVAGAQTGTQEPAPAQAAAEAASRSSACSANPWSTC